MRWLFIEPHKTRNMSSTFRVFFSWEFIKYEVSFLICILYVRDVFLFLLNIMSKWCQLFFPIWRHVIKYMHEPCHHDTKNVFFFKFNFLFSTTFEEISLILSLIVFKSWDDLIYYVVFSLLISNIRIKLRTYNLRNLICKNDFELLYKTLGNIC